MESKLWKKLNYKGQDRVVILNAPEEFSEHFRALRKTVNFSDKPGEEAFYDFALLFAQNQSDISMLFKLISEKLEADAVFWVAYPKKSSAKYRSDISRDQGWQILGGAGYEGVRQVAIDENWSALRFRKAEFIRSMKREQSRAMSARGKKRTKK